MAEHGRKTTHLCWYKIFTNHKLTLGDACEIRSVYGSRISMADFGKAVWRRPSVIWRRYPLQNLESAEAM